jgi:hypothetical protein
VVNRHGLPAVAVVALTGRGQRPAPGTLVATGVVAALFAAYAAVVDAVADPAPLSALDGPTLRWMVDHRSAPMTTLMREISNAGGTLGMTVLTALGWRRRRPTRRGCGPRHHPAIRGHHRCGAVDDLELADVVAAQQTGFLGPLTQHSQGDRVDRASLGVSGWPAGSRPRPERGRRDDRRRAPEGRNTRAPCRRSGMSSRAGASACAGTGSPSSVRTRERERSGFPARRVRSTARSPWCGERCSPSPPLRWPRCGPVTERADHYRLPNRRRLRHRLPDRPHLRTPLPPSATERSSTARPTDCTPSGAMVLPSSPGPSRPDPAYPSGGRRPQAGR